MQVVNNYLEMMKFRISMLVMLTGYLGFYLGLRSQGLLSIDYYDKLVYLLIGMFLSSSGCAVLNQYLENTKCIHCGENEIACLRFYPHDKEIRKTIKRVGMNDESRKTVKRLIDSSNIVCSNCLIKIENDLLDPTFL